MITASNPNRLLVVVVQRGMQAEFSDRLLRMNVFRPSPAIYDGSIPDGALLGDDGQPLRDDNGNILMKDN